MIECIASGLPVGLGEPVFNKLDALLSHAIMSIGAVKGVEIGDGLLFPTLSEAPTTILSASEMERR